MSEIMLSAPETEAVDWRALADEVFPADALRTSPPTMSGYRGDRGSSQIGERK